MWKRSIHIRKTAQKKTLSLVYFVLVILVAKVGGHSLEWLDKMQADPSFMTDHDKKGLYEFIR